MKLIRNTKNELRGFEIRSTATVYISIRFDIDNIRLSVDGSFLDVELLRSVLPRFENQNGSHTKLYKTINNSVVAGCDASIGAN